MERCRKLVDVGRRQFLKGSAFAAAGAAAAVSLPARRPGRRRVWHWSNIRPTVSPTSRPESQRAAGRHLSRPGCPGRAVEARTRVEGGAGPDGDIVGFTTLCPHKGFPLNYNADDAASIAPATIRGSTAERAASRSGAMRPRTCRSTRCASTTRATSTPRASMSCSTAACPTCSEGGSNHGLQASNRPPADHPGGRQGPQRHLPLLHRRLRLPRLHLGRRTSRAAPAPGDNVFGVDLSKQQQAETEAWYSPSMYNIVKQNGAGRPYRHQARPGLRGEFRPRLDPRRAHGRDELLAQHATRSCSA